MIVNLTNHMAGATIVVMRSESGTSTVSSKRRYFLRIFGPNSTQYV